MKRAKFSLVTLGLILGFFWMGLPQVNSQTEVLLFEATLSSDNQVELENLEIILGELSFFSEQGDYKLQIFSAEGQLLFEKPFLISFERSVDVFGEEGKIQEGLKTLEEAKISLRLPLLGRADYLTVLYQDQAIFELDLAEELCLSEEKDSQCHWFCQDRALDPDCFQCGNTLCEPGEDEASCPVDCRVGGVVIYTPPKAGLLFSPIFWGIVWGGGFLVLLAFLLYSLLKKKRS